MKSRGTTPTPDMLTPEQQNMAREKPSWSERIRKAGQGIAEAQSATSGGGTSVDSWLQQGNVPSIYALEKMRRRLVTGA